MLAKLRGRHCRQTVFRSELKRRRRTPQFASTGLSDALEHWVFGQQRITIHQLTRHLVRSPQRICFRELSGDFVERECSNPGLNKCSKLLSQSPSVRLVLQIHLVVAFNGIELLLETASLGQGRQLTRRKNAYHHVATITRCKVTRKCAVNLVAETWSINVIDLSFSKKTESGRGRQSNVLQGKFDQLPLTFARPISLTRQDSCR